MSKTKIEWCDYSINPVKGLCPVACPYCYARRMYKRFKWNPEIQWDEQCLIDLKKIKKPSRIFVGSTMELFGDWIGESAIESIFWFTNKYPQHTFIFLTKRPQNLIKWSPFPQNAWVGLSVDGTENAPLRRIYNGLADTKATVKFISFEPLLASTNLDYRDLEWAGINWIIIGAQKPYSIKTFPKWEWVKEIIDAADKTNTPIFLKNNLRLPKYSCEGATPFYKRGLTGTMELRQEFPNANLE